MSGHNPRRGDTAWDSGAVDGALVHICDPAGRARGTGFAADHEGTVVTALDTLDALDGMEHIVVHAPGGAHAPGDLGCVLGAEEVTRLPEAGLALLRTSGLELRPLPVTVRTGIPVGTYVRIAAGGWREARVLGVTPTPTPKPPATAVGLAVGTAGSDALRIAGHAVGGPVLDAASGAVLGVLGRTSRPGHGAAGFAVPLRAAATAGRGGPLSVLLEHNAANVPAYGADLNAAAVLQLAATSVGTDALRPGPGHVERPEITEEFGSFERGQAVVLGLVGEPGTGRTTELAALAARRAHGRTPCPTLWLRGADLHASDSSLLPAASRALARAARIVSAARPRSSDDAGDVSFPRAARVARDAGRPLLVVLDGPEEMPEGLLRRLSEWSAVTVRDLHDAGVRLVVACRTGYWEQAGAQFPQELLHGADAHLPACVRLGELSEQQAQEARDAYGIPEGALAVADARHPLALRLLSEVRAALADSPRNGTSGTVPRGILDTPPDGAPDRAEILGAHLDLTCLRIAWRLADAGTDAGDPRGSAVRRLATRVACRVHEAARHCLGEGHGGLDRAAFAALFPWRTGWASAVLAEGLLVPAGPGYRFAYDELADWLQGTHLDLDAALGSLVHDRGPVPAPDAVAHNVTVPRHRIGPVLQALLQLSRQQRSGELARHLRELTEAADELLSLPSDDLPSDDLRSDDLRSDDPAADACWWAVQLLAGVLVRVPDATPYLGVLRALADRVVRWPRPPVAFGLRFWAEIRLREEDRFDLRRRLVVADGPHGSGRRHLDVVAESLALDPAVVQRRLTHWFTDERPLNAAPDATVAKAAQALLHTHRHRAVDDLTEALVDCAHPRAEELLTIFAEDEPSAMCRAVDRWAHDDRPARYLAAAAHGPRTAAYATTPADRLLLRYAALALLGRRPADGALHGPAFALLLRDPQTRAKHLAKALRCFTDHEGHLPAAALSGALDTHPEPVLAAVRTKLTASGPPGAPERPGRGDPADLFLALADVRTSATACRIASLVRELLDRRPEAGPGAALFLDRRLEHGPAARAVLHPLVTGLLHNGPPRVRAAIAPVLADAGTALSRPLREELLEVLLTRERDPAVLGAVLGQAAEGTARRGEAATRALLHRVGVRLAAVPQGADRFAGEIVDSARTVPGFAVLVSRWITDTPRAWDALLGPAARRLIEDMAGSRVPV